MTKKIRPIRISGDIAYVPLTKGFTAVIDAADALLVGGFNWFAIAGSRTFYAARTDYSGGKTRAIRMHRLILGEPDGFQVDHEDGDGLNNRRGNLREATHAQNMHNRRPNIRSKSGLKGVGWEQKSGKWNAKIKVNGKSTFLGMFTTPEEAHSAYCLASEKYHGEFGRTE